MQAVAKGDGSAYRTLVEDFFPYVNGFVLAHCGGNKHMAEDVMAETLTEVYRSAASFRGESALTTWLCTIARRRLSRAFERERRQSMLTQRINPRAAAPELDRHGVRRLQSVPVDDGVALDERDEIVRALARLPAEYRQALTLKYLDGCSVEQIATQFGRTRIQIQSMLQRARSAFRKELKRGRA